MTWIRSNTIDTLGCYTSRSLCAPRDTSPQAAGFLPRWMTSPRRRSAGRRLNRTDRLGTNRASIVGTRIGFMAPVESLMTSGSSKNSPGETVWGYTPEVPSWSEPRGHCCRNFSPMCPRLVPSNANGKRQQTGTVLCRRDPCSQRLSSLPLAGITLLESLSV
jgi:hypothetical protein